MENARRFAIGGLFANVCTKIDTPRIELSVVSRAPSSWTDVDFDVRRQPAVLDRVFAFP